MTQDAEGVAIGDDVPYVVLYNNGFAEEVPDLTTARMRVMRPETRPDEASKEPIATYRRAKVE